jgi:hypothetical protein
MDTSTSTSTSTCHRLKTAVEELKNEIDELNDKILDTSSDIYLINNLLDILQTFYSEAPEGETENIYSLLQVMINPTFSGDGAEKAKDEYEKNKNLYIKMVSFIWNRQSKFLWFVRYMIPRKGHTPEEIYEKFKTFLETLTNTIEQTTAILKSKNDKEKEVPSTKDKKLFSFPNFLKSSFGLGRRAAYDALLEEIKRSEYGGSCSPEQYFSMLHTMGLIAIKLCEKYISTDTPMNIESLKVIVAATPKSEESAPSGGSTSRRRNHRRNHSRKSINRNKKSKKIRKIYTSKRRARRRNQNKSKNKSRK